MQKQWYFVFWDLESTDKHPKEDDIISLGAVLARYSNDAVNRFQKIDTFHSYVMTTKEISEGAYDTHHISQEMISTAPFLPLVMEEWQTWILSHTQGDPVIFVAHNGRTFDEIMLFCNCHRYHINFEAFVAAIHCHGFFDSLKFMPKICPQLGLDPPKDLTTGRVRYRLGDCFRRFQGSCLENGHDALVDSEALFAIFTAPELEPHLTLSLLLQFTEIRVKVLDKIKQTAGLAFQRDQALAQKRFLALTAPTDSPLLHTVALEDYVIWEPASFHQKIQGQTYALCYNCVTYNPFDEPHTCQVN